MRRTSSRRSASKRPSQPARRPVVYLDPLGGSADAAPSSANGCGQHGDIVAAATASLDESLWYMAGSLSSSRVCAVVSCVLCFGCDAVLQTQPRVANVHPRADCLRQIGHFQEDISFSLLLAWSSRSACCLPLDQLLRSVDARCSGHDDGVVDGSDHPKATIQSSVGGDPCRRRRQPWAYHRPCAARRETFRWSSRLIGRRRVLRHVACRRQRAGVYEFRGRTFRRIREHRHGEVLSAPPTLPASGGRHRRC